MYKLKPKHQRPLKNAISASSFQECFAMKAEKQDNTLLNQKGRSNYRNMSFTIPNTTHVEYAII